MSLLTRKFIRILGLVQGYPYTNIASHQSVRFSTNKDISFVRGAIKQDLLYQSLKNAASTDNIFELVSSHHTIMNNKHLMQAFRSLFNVQKTSSSNNMIRKEIQSHPDFKKLCLSLKAHMRAIELNEVIEALKILSYIGVPANSTIVQMLLQITRHNINHMKLQQIIFLDFLLNQFQSTPLSDALLIAFPIVIEAQLPQKLDRQNMQHLSDLLQYASKNKLSESTITVLINAIQETCELDSRAAMSIVWSLCDLKPRDDFEPVLKRALKTINRGRDFKIADLETTLTKLSYRFNSNQSFYYQKEFFDLVAEHVVNNNIGFQQTLWILKKFSKVNYTNDALLDYIATLSHKEVNLISKTSAWNLFNLVAGFSGTEYKPLHWECVRQGILENENIYDVKREFNWITFATRLAILDIFIPKVLENAFKSECIERYLENGSYETCQNYLLLHQTLTTLHPEYSNVLLDDCTYLEDVYKYVYSSWVPFEPLKGALEKSFGGKSYVLTNVTTKSYHLLHHVVVMRKGGYPIGINYEIDEPTILEHLQLPNDNHIIAIFGCDSCYYKPSVGTILRDHYNLLFRTIEASGCSVVPVCITTWMQLLDHEKIPYLMQAIRIKNEQFENKISVVQ